MVSDVAPVEQAQACHLSFVTDEKYVPFLKTTQAGAVLITRALVKDEVQLANDKAALILVENARGAGLNVGESEMLGVESYEPG